MTKFKMRKFGQEDGVELPQIADRESLFLGGSPDDSCGLMPDDRAFGLRMARADDIIERYRNALRTLAQ